jgi:hypothetical protein
MTSQGSAYARFRRALQTGNATVAWAAASELPHVDLADALWLVTLIPTAERRYDWAAARWLGRFSVESSHIGLTETAEALKCLQDGLTGDALQRLAAVSAHLGHQDVARTALERARATGS